MTASQGYDLEREYAALRKFFEHRADGLALIGEDHSEKTYKLIEHQSIPAVTLWNYSELRGFLATARITRGRESWRHNILWIWGIGTSACCFRRQKTMIGHVTGAVGCSRYSLMQGPVLPRIGTSRLHIALRTKNAPRRGCWQVCTGQLRYCAAMMCCPWASYMPHAPAI